MENRLLINRILMFLVFGITLVSLAGGCGGGGGSSRSSQPAAPTAPPTPPPAPPTPTSTTPLTIDQTNALDVSRLSLATPEALLQIAFAASNRAIKHLNDENLSIAESCNFGGRYESVVTDSDNSQSLSKGDQVLIRLIDDCGLLELVDQATGQIELTVFELQRETNGDLILEGRITLPQPLRVQIQVADATDPNSQDIDLTVRASFNFALVSVPDGEFERLEIRAVGNDVLEFEVTASIDGTTLDRSLAFSLERKLQQDVNGQPRYQTAFTADYQSDLVTGAFSCTTTTELVGGRRSQPDSGQIQCDGSNGSAIRLSSLDNPIGSRVEVLFTTGTSTMFLSAGDFNEMAGQSNWADVLDGSLYTLYANRLDRLFVDGSPNVIPNTIAFAAVTAAAIDVASNRIYVSNSSGIVALDAQTLATLDSVSVVGQPGPLVVSDDGSSVWFGFSDRAEIQRLDTATFVLDLPVSLGTSPASISLDERIAKELRIAPGSNSLVVVSMRNDSEVVAYNGGVELPSQIQESRGPGRFVFTGNSTLTGYDDTTTGREVFVFSLDPGTGLSLDNTFPRLGPGFSGSELHLGSRDLFSDAGTAFNTDLQAQTNQLNLAETSYTQTAIDLANNRLYALERLGQRYIEVYQESPLQRIAQFRVDQALGDDRELLIGTDAVFVVMESSIHRIEKSDFENSSTEDLCPAFDFSGIASSTNYLQINCKVSDIAYDATRDRLYAALPVNLNAVGNSIASFDPQSGQLESTLPLNVSPTRFHVSAGDQLLYALGASVNGYVKVDLNASTDPELIPAGYRFINNNVPYAPYSPVGLTSSQSNSNRVALAFSSRDLALYDDGSRLVRIAETPSIDVRHLFFNTGGSSLFGYFADRLVTMDVLSDGLAVLSDSTSLISGSTVIQQGDELISSGGQRLSLGTLTGSSNCLDTATLAPEPIIYADSNLLYSAQLVNGRLLIGVCDQNTGERNTSEALEGFGGTFDSPQKLLGVSGGRLAIQLFDRVLIVDRPNAPPG